MDRPGKQKPWFRTSPLIPTERNARARDRNTAHMNQSVSQEYRFVTLQENIGPQGVQEAICIWGVTRNMFFSVTRIVTEVRVEIGGRGGDEADALLRRVTLDQSRTDWPPLDKLLPQDTTAVTGWILKSLREHGCKCLCCYICNAAGRRFQTKPRRYGLLLGPEGTESKNADGLLVVVFLSQRRSFLIFRIL